MRQLRIGLAQVNVTVGDVEGNTRRVLDEIERARPLGVDLVAFPELCLTGYPPEDLLFRSAFIEANLRALDRVARASAGLIVVVGFVDRRDDIMNAAAVCHDGQVAGVYHKQYLPNYGVFDENRYFQAGVETPVFELGEGGPVLAVNICEDIWYPTGPTTAQTLAGAELVVSINSSPYHVGKVRFREKMLATRAADHVGYLAFVNLVGGQDELVFDGQSMVFDPAGDRLALGRAFEEDLVVADLDLDAAFRARLAGLAAAQGEAGGGRPGAPGAAPGPAGAAAAAGAGAVDDVPRPGSRRCTPRSCPGTRDYVRKNGFRRVVVGLSGGIDSALTAAIAVDALGREGVVGVSMPSPFSSAGTRADARRVARNLGIEFLTLPITPGLPRLPAGPGGAVQGAEGGRGRGERPGARARHAPDGAVEQVRLARADDRQQERDGRRLLHALRGHGRRLRGDQGRPQDDGVRARRAGGTRGTAARSSPSPSSGARRRRSCGPTRRTRTRCRPTRCWIPILEAYVEEDRSLADIVALGYDEATVRQVVTMVDRNEYKRRQAPPGVKITPRAFGRDWRLPISNRFRHP